MKIVVYTMLFAFSTIALMAQSGSIEGKVTDAETGEALRGASVSVVATKKGSYTDSKGTFRIKKVAPGTYAIRVTFIGYDPKVVEGIIVGESEPATVSVLLGATKKTGKEVTNLFLSLALMNAFPFSIPLFVVVSLPRNAQPLPASFDLILIACTFLSLRR